tara:strand:+ start:1734 stop:2123 length:390 start_codon:yes stop_codon:yes gene_type:complete
MNRREWLEKRVERFENTINKLPSSSPPLNYSQDMMESLNGHDRARLEERAAKRKALKSNNVHQGNRFNCVLSVMRPDVARYQIEIQNNNGKSYRIPEAHYRYRDFDNYLSGLIEGSEMILDSVKKALNG